MCAPREACVRLVDCLRKLCIAAWFAVACLSYPQDEPLVYLTMSRTKKAPIRVEVWAKTAGGTRGFVCTLTETKHGAKLEEHSRMLYRKVMAEKLSKKQISLYLLQLAAS